MFDVSCSKDKEVPIKLDYRLSTGNFDSRFSWPYMVFDKI